MSSSARSSTVFHIPSLDGVRALAVSIVFLGHMYGMPSAFPGHVGVTIFFFLSGYLITTLLRREYERNGKISLRKFYLRRLLRIQPPAFLAIMVALLLGITGILAAEVSAQGVLAEVIQVTNYYLITTDSRSGLPPESSMLWSLAVEEHYYLIFPALLIVFFRLSLGIRRIGWILVGIAVAIGLWRTVLVFSGASFFHLYTGTDTRADSLLYGSAMALLINPMYRDSERAPARLTKMFIRIAPLAAMLLGLSALIPARAFRFTVADVIQCLCLVAVFWWIIARPLSWAGCVLNQRVLARIGVLSFSIYLFHRMVIAVMVEIFDAPVITDLREQLLDLETFARIAAVNLLAIPVTLLVAEAIYQWIEAPCAQIRRSLEAGSTVTLPAQPSIKSISELDQPASRCDLSPND